MRRVLWWLGRALGRTSWFVGALALKLGPVRKVVLILGALVALVVLGLLLLAFVLLRG